MFFYKHKTAYEMRISDWSSGVCSSDLGFAEADLQFVFLVQGVFLTLIGILFGWMLGYGLMEILASLQFPIAGEDQRIPLDRGFRQYAIAAAASLTAGAVAAWLPARKTSRVDTVDILRGAV